MSKSTNMKQRVISSERETYSHAIALPLDSRPQLSLASPLDSPADCPAHQIRIWRGPRNRPSRSGGWPQATQRQKSSANKNVIPKGRAVHHFFIPAGTFWSKAVAVCLCFAMVFSSVDLAYAALPTSTAAAPLVAAETSLAASPSPAPEQAPNPTSNPASNPDSAPNPESDLAPDPDSGISTDPDDGGEQPVNPEQPEADEQPVPIDPGDEPDSQPLPDATPDVNNNAVTGSDPAADDALLPKDETTQKPSDLAVVSADLKLLGRHLGDITPQAVVGDVFQEASDEGLDITYKVTGTYATTGSYTVQVGSGTYPGGATSRSYAGTLSVPSTVAHEGTTYKVTALGDYAFYSDLDAAMWTMQLSAINLPNTITSIGNYALSGLYNVRSLTIPSSVSHLGRSAFAANKFTSITFAGSSPITEIPDDCFRNSGLTAIDIPSGVTIIGLNAFANVPIASIVIPAGVTEIRDSAFSGSALQSIDIPAKVNFLGNNVFNKCEQLVTATFDPSTSLQEIPIGAFRACKLLRAISMPTTVKSIEGSAFENSGLVSFAVSDTVSYLGARAFANCGQLARVTFGSANKMLNIPANLFLNCSLLETVTLPKTVRTIGDSAFQGCSTIAAAVIPVNVTSLGDSAFMDCSSLATVTFMGDASKISTLTSTFYLDDKLLKIVYRGKKSRSLNLPSSQPTYYYSINYYDNKTAMETPGTEPTQLFIIQANSIPQSAPASQIYQGYLPNPPDANSKWVYEEGFGITGEIVNSFYAYGRSKDQDTVVGGHFSAYTIERNLVTYKVLGLPNEAQNRPGVVAVDNGLSTAITANTMGSVTIPEIVVGPDSLRYSVAQISPGAFKDCANFVGLTIPSTVTFIGANAFLRCTNLRNVFFSSDASKIVDVGIFDGCTNIQVVVFGGKKANVSFGLSNPTVYYTVSYYDSEHDQQIGNKQAAVVVRARTLLESLRAGDIRSGSIPELPMGYKWVYETGFLGSAPLSDSCYVYAEGIGFQYNITVRGNTPELMPCWFKVSSFDKATGKGTVQVGVDLDGMPAVHSSAKGIPVIPASVSDADGNQYTVTGIGEYAFGASNRMIACAYITAVEFPSTIKTIGGYAFANCRDLGSISIPAGVTKMGSNVFDGCAKLTTAQFAGNGSLAAIPAYTFNACTSLKTVVLPLYCSSIQTAAFSGCAALQSISLPTELKTIGDFAFQRCSGLKSVDFPAGIVSIGAGAFSGCSSVATLTFVGNASKVVFGASAFGFGTSSSLSAVIFRDKKASRINNFITAGTNLDFDPDGNEYGRHYYVYYTIRFYENIGAMNANRPTSLYTVREDLVPGAASAPYLKAGNTWSFEPGFLLSARATDSFYGYGGLNISAASVSGLKDEYPYTGDYVKPRPTLTMPDGTVLREGVDFAYDSLKGVARDGYVNNRRQGTASIYLVGINNYAGSKIATFAISGFAAYLMEASFSGPSSFIYSGEQHRPQVTVRLTYRGATEAEAFTSFRVGYQYNVDANQKQASERTRPEVIIYGTGDYEYLEPVSLKFDIEPYPLNKCDVDGEVEVSEAAAPIAKLSVTHTPIAKKLNEGEDYDVVFKLGMTKTKVTTYLSGKGNYTGMVQLRSETSAGEGGGGGGGEGPGIGDGTGPGSGPGSGTGIAGDGAGGLAGTGSQNNAMGFSPDASSQMAEGSTDPGASGGGGGDHGKYAIYALSDAAVSVVDATEDISRLFQMIVLLSLLIILFLGAIYSYVQFQKARGKQAKPLVGAAALLPVVMLVVLTLPGCVATVAQEPASSGDAAELAIDDTVAATVNNNQIMESAVTDLVNKARLADPELQTDQAWLAWLETNGYTAASFRDAKLENLIDDSLINQVAAENGVVIAPTDIDAALELIKQKYLSEEDWVAALEQLGYTEEVYREETRIGLLQAQLQSVIDDAAPEFMEETNPAIKVSKYLNYIKSQATIQINPMPKGLPYDV